MVWLISLPVKIQRNQSKIFPSVLWKELWVVWHSLWFKHFFHNLLGKLQNGIKLSKTLKHKLNVKSLVLFSYFLHFCSLDFLDYQWQFSCFLTESNLPSPHTKTTSSAKVSTTKLARYSLAFIIWIYFSLYIFSTGSLSNLWVHITI